MSAHTLFRHYLVTASRNLVKHKLYSFINIAGLSISLACAIFITLFVRDELSYDRWIADSANLYRVEVTFNLPGHAPMQLPYAPFPVPRLMQESIPEVTAMTRLAPESMNVAAEGRVFAESVAVVDPNFFEVIKLPLVQGDPTLVLAQPESIVISQSMSRKYFGGVDPIGKTLLVDGVHAVTVTGVLRDLPHNTQLTAEFVMPNTSRADQLSQDAKENGWGDAGKYGYVMLAPHADPNAVLAKLRSLLDRAFNPAKTIGVNIRASEFDDIHLTQFWKVHLTSDNFTGGLSGVGGLRPPGSWTTIYGFAVIAVLIVLVACCNFMNLATAHATLRAKEISLRKSMGATRRQLVVQFLGEALLTALIALLMALALVEVLLPAYDGFLGRPLEFHYLADWPLFMAILAGTIAAGLLSGIYPALVLSGLKPAATLRTNASGQSGRGLIRAALVVSQFSVSIGLGIAAIVVFSQIKFAQALDLGFDCDGIVVIDSGYLPRSAKESFVHALAAYSGIAGVAQSDEVPFKTAGYVRQLRRPGDPQDLSVHVLMISPEFSSVYGIRLLAGRLLSNAQGQDMFSIDAFSVQRNGKAENLNILINEAAAHSVGLTPHTAVGKTLLFQGAHVVVVGVLADSKIGGAKDPVAPTVFLNLPEAYAVLSVRIHGGDVSDTLAYIDKTWRLFAPSAPIERYFLSDSFDGQFTADEKQGAMFGLFVGIAIFIACLGLFGLAAFAAQRRTKEIGVRKVFGARTTDIVRLLLWQFSIPVLLANAIAWPVAYYYLHHWLERYAYRIALNPLYFLSAGALALAIAWATVLVHALNVARANPVHALRHE